MPVMPGADAMDDFGKEQFMKDARFLLDDYEISGEKEDAFEEAVKDIDTHTYYTKVCLRSLSLLSIMEKEKQDPEQFPGVLRAWRLDPGNHWRDGKTAQIPGYSFPTQKLLPLQAGEQPADSELMRETMEKNPTMVINRESASGDAVYYVSSLAANTMAQRLGIASDTMREHSLARDIFVAHRLDREEEATLVIKQYRQIGKIFAMMSSSYRPIPLHELCVVYKDLMGHDMESKPDGGIVYGGLGPMKCEGWSITHKRARISFSFEQYGDKLCSHYGLTRPMVPCVELQTSDIGESSFVVRGYWKLKDNGAVVYDASYAKEHRGKSLVDGNLDKVEEEIRKNVLGQYPRLPERLVGLKEVNITPPGLNLSKCHNGTIRNHKAVLAAYKQAFKQLGMVKVLSKKRMDSILRAIDWHHIDDHAHYTAYDLVMDIFSLSETLRPYMEKEGMNQETVRKFRECISGAAYVELGGAKEGNQEIPLAKAN